MPEDRVRAAGRSPYVGSGVSPAEVTAVPLADAALAVEFAAIRATTDRSPSAMRRIFAEHDATLLAPGQTTFA